VKWIRAGGDSVPENIRDRAGINTSDQKLVNDIIIPTFRYNHAVVDFFLQQVVFPRQAKEFPSKLGTSGWDLAAHKPNVTTGFSGTKDNRFLLPTSIEQGEPATPQQHMTDALVLSYLFQPENSYHAFTQPLSGKEHLHFIVSQEPEIRVLLDVGAQLLDLKNEALARDWLHRASEKTAAIVFFTDADELTVLARNGTIEPLRSSPYSERLEECIVYLDDAHTRGTDLKLPKNTRAALTLGPKVTKDRIVQGGQSIITVVCLTLTFHRCHAPAQARTRAVGPDNRAP
jgi:hypothetical protein